jgi:hypothetical protein
MVPFPPLMLLAGAPPPPLLLLFITALDPTPVRHEERDRHWNRLAKFFPSAPDEPLTTGFSSMSRMGSLVLFVELSVTGPAFVAVEVAILVYPISKSTIGAGAPRLWIVVSLGLFNADKIWW